MSPAPDMRPGAATPPIHVNRPPVSAAWIGRVLCTLSIAACAGTAPSPQPEAPQVTAPSVATVSIAPAGAAPTPPLDRAPTTRSDRVDASRAPPVSTSQPREATRLAASKAGSAATVASAPAPAPIAAKSQAQPPLDIKSLETRLKETKAIGVFTKLALKNQVDDLLKQFRAFYEGQLKTTLAELRRPYELLVLKVLALLQDTDPPLAVAIASSRESIWGILSNREKFAAV